MTINQPIPSIRLRVVPASGRSDIILFLLYIGGYAALVAWFRYIDVYHTHFSDTGILVFLDNLFRLLFVFYLFWIVQAVGAVFLRLFGECNPRALGTLGYVALTFFAGAGPWHVVLLAVGYLGLLNAPVMMVLTAPIAALSFREFRVVAPRTGTLLRSGFIRGSNACKAGGILLAVVWFALFLVKGLNPGAGGGDYFLHYFPAYQAFLEHGSVWPNEVWWHYFYSKGAGLYFLGMLLTDALAPQLVTFCFMSVAGLSIFLFVRRLAPRTAWPIVGVLLFFGLYIYTPGWGEFGKLHELNTALVITILWMTVVAFDGTRRARGVWLAAAASTMTAAVIVNTVIGIFLGAFFAVLALPYALLSYRRRVLVCLAFATAAGALACGILLINYLTTGLLNDLALRHGWKFADVERLYQWGALPKALWWHRQLTGFWGVPFERSTNFLYFVLRFYLLWPLFFGGVLVACIAGYTRYSAGHFGCRAVSNAALVLTAAFLVFVAFAVTEGRGLSTSFYRFSSFMVPVVIVAGIAMWTAPIRHPARASGLAMVERPLVPFIVLASCAVVIAVKTRVDRDMVPLAVNALKYAAGMLSTDDAYVHQANGRPAGPWGGIYPGARGAYGIVGPHIPIWSMHLGTYCMLPDCKMMYYAPFLMTRSWERVMWGTPEEAQSALRSAGLNYFLFSRELVIRDPLPLSPLFSPDNIARYFGIRWTDGTTTLLTWSGPDTTPLDEAWVREYRRAVAQAEWLGRFPNAEMRAVFERLRATPRPWRSVELPWQSGATR